MDPSPTAPSAESTAADMEVLVVVLAFAEGVHLDACLASLREQTHAKTTFALVGTAETLAAKPAGAFKDARIEAESAPAICAAANGLADQWEHFDLVVFVRDDVRLAPDAVDQACLAVGETLAGAVGGKVYAADGEDLLVEAGMSADRFGVPFSRLEGFELDQSQYDVRRQTLYSSFAFLAVRGPLLAAVGGFDTVMRGPGNDLDLCWRIRIAGEDIVYTPGVRVWRTAEPRDSEEIRDLAGRNRVWMVAKNYGPLRALLFSVEGVLLALAAALAAMVQGRGEEARHAFSAHGWAIASLRTLLRDRRGTQRLRTVRDGAVVKFMLGATARFRTRSDVREAEGGGGLGRAVANLVRALGGRWLIVAALLVLFLLLAGRHLLTGPLPAFGRLGPPDQSALDYVRSLSGHWQNVSVGSPSPSSPILFLSGLAGFLALGSVQLAQRILLVLGVAAAAWSCARSLRPLLGHTASRVSAAVVYALGPLLWNALADGDLGVVALAVLLPPIARRLACVGGLPAYEDGAPLMRRKLELVALTALACAAEPATIWVVFVVLGGWAAGSVLAGGAHRSVLALWAGVQALAGAFVLLLPWSFSLLQGDGAARAFAAAPTEIPFLDLIRFDTGRFGGTVLAFGLLALALLPLLLARNDQLAWAIRWWGTAIVAFFVTWMVGLGFLPALGRANVLVLPAAFAFAVLAGLGVEAIRRNLPEFQVGVQQPLSVILVLLGVAGLVSPLAAVPAGRFGQPETDWRASLSWQFDLAADEGPFVTVFLGASVPGDPIPIGDDLYISTAAPGGPSLQDLWMPRTTDGAARLADDMALTAAGRVPFAGRLLAAYSVRYIAVGRGEDELVRTLTDALDLTLQQEDDSGILFENKSWRPQVAGTESEVSAASRSPAEEASTPPPPASSGWEFDPPSTWKGKTDTHVRARVTYDGSFRLETDGEEIEPEKAGGWAMQFATAPDQDARLVLDAGPLRTIVVVIIALVWIVTLGGMIGLRSSDDQQ
ncbi:MAG: glycosyltransferase family 2 protein [Acidimicrobiia bacterium]|nr:glycosyltransferase family 2 protein [Acidimicrobiia bacterium]